MAQSRIAHHPTLRQLLDSETMAEAHIAVGQTLLDRSVVQVVGTLSPTPRAGSLLVLRSDTLSVHDIAALKEMAGLVVIRGGTGDCAVATVPASAAGNIIGVTVASPSSTAAVSVDVWLKRLAKECEQILLPLIVVPGFGETAQIADEIRMAFLKELKSGSARLHASLMTLLLEEGLEGLVEEVSNSLNRPVAVETADFKVLASRNMGATPTSQQQAVAEEVAESSKRLRFHGGKSTVEVSLPPIKAGRRLILPVVLGEAVVGYISAMFRPNDDIDAITEYLQPAALAVMVEFNQRRKDGSVFAVTQKSLLKDLLSGRSLSASDQERLERYYGFDLSDGLLVFAVEANLGLNPATPFRAVLWPEDSFITAEVEGTRVFVLPHQGKEDKKWNEEAQSLLVKIRKNLGVDGETARIQIGAARLAHAILDLPDAYREARQALIVGSMVHGEKEFITGYGDLGIKRLLYLMIDHPELDRFYEENLAPLETYDSEWESELVSSLRIYLEHGANLNSAARALFIHRHTLRYRLEQIADILKVDIDSQEVLLNLQIAFLIRDMKGFSGGNPNS
jgi:sugar diacid utilization regulator